ncbi:MAG TPA: hypothetical protein VLA74_05190 [Nitrososphaeraceae archaeon]|nr:hypothetical protein [Nitrososphaeraceae archaeon]
MNINQNQPYSKNNNFQDTSYMNIDSYEEVFYLIKLLTKKYIIPNIDTLPENVRFDPNTFYVRIGEKYKRHSLENLYFFPEGFAGPGANFFISEGLRGPSSCELNEIFDNLYPPQQILDSFYKTLMTFAKDNTRQIQGLRLSLQFMKLILENEEEQRDWILYKQNQSH